MLKPPLTRTSISSKISSNTIIPRKKKKKISDKEREIKHDRDVEKKAKNELKKHKCAE